VAGRPSKTLTELVLDGTFRARRHHELLAGEDVQWRSLAGIQAHYRAADHELERRRLAVDFENAIPLLHQRRARLKKDLPELLAGLGPAGSVERVAGIAHRFCRLENGRRFRLEPWQLEVLRRFLRRDSRGRRIFKVLLLGIPRGNGKTPFASLLSLDALLDGELYESKNVFQVAGSKEQARIGFEFASGWVHDGELNEWVKVKRTLECRRRAAAAACSPRTAGSRTGASSAAAGRRALAVRHLPGGAVVDRARDGAPQGSGV
jgi:hypothetical protein